MAANENRPVMRNPQTFVLPVSVVVDSDAGGVTGEQLQGHARAQLDHLLEQTLPDLLDRDARNPMPFAFHGATALWQLLSPLDQADPDAALVAAKLTGHEVKALRVILRCELTGLLSREARALIEKFGVDKASDSPPLL